MAQARLGIGIVAFGFIGSELCRYLGSDAVERLGLEPSFVHARRMETLDGVAPAHHLARLKDGLPEGTSLVVEAAHPSITVRHGADILKQADWRCHGNGL